MLKHEEVLHIGRDIRKFSSQVNDLNSRLRETLSIEERLRSRLQYYENKELMLLLYHRYCQNILTRKLKL